MASFWKIVSDVIENSDVVLIVLDARFVEQTLNSEVERLIEKGGKPVIHVINKCDLVDKSVLEKYKTLLHPCVFISSKEFHGVNLLKERIFQEGRKGRSKDDEVVVGVVGYPNTGKSSLINAMTGRGAASTSAVSGWTQSMKKIRASGGLLFLDTPGVIPMKETDVSAQAIIGAVDVTKIKDVDVAVARIMEEYPGVVEGHYGVEVQEDQEDAVAQIAIKLKMLVKGGEPDINRAYAKILKDWQSGKIKK